MSSIIKGGAIFWMSTKEAVMICSFRRHVHYCEITYSTGRLKSVIKKTSFRSLWLLHHGTFYHKRTLLKRWCTKVIILYVICNQTKKTTTGILFVLLLVVLCYAFTSN